MIVKLLGELGKIQKREYQFEVSTLYEAMQALSANIPYFRHKVVELLKRGYDFIAEVNGALLSKDELYLPISGILKIMPIVKLADPVTSIIVGSILIGGGWYAATVGISAIVVSALYGMGASMILSGVLSFLMPAAKIPERDGIEQATSSFFANSGQKLQSGMPIPVGYGKLRIPGHMVSLHITTEIV